MMETAAPETSFQLIETMKWQAGAGFWLLDRHLARLAASALHFGFACDVAAVERALGDLAGRLGGGTHRVRLLLAADGGIALSHAAIDVATPPRTLRLAWAQQPVDAGDPFLRHKTTRRALYEGELDRARSDVVAAPAQRSGDREPGARWRSRLPQLGRLRVARPSIG